MKSFPNYYKLPMIKMKQPMMKSYSSSKDSFFWMRKLPNLKKENLWFEEEELKKDKMYYDTIVQLTQNFLQYCESKENFRVDLLVQEINQIMKNSIFATYYEYP